MALDCDSYIQPVSFNQEQRLVTEFLAREQRSTLPAFNLVSGLLLSGSLDVMALGAAARATLEAPSALRLSIVPNPTLTYSQLRARSSHFHRTGLLVPGSFGQRLVGAGTVPIVHNTLSSAGTLESALCSTVQHTAAEPFQYDSPPHLRIHLYVTATNEYALVLILPHILSDGWSMRVFQRQLLQNYALITGGHSAQPNLGPLLTDWIRDEREHLFGGRYDASLAYWRRTWAALEDTLPRRDELPFTRQSERLTWDSKLVTHHFDCDMSSEINRALRRLSTTPYVFFRSCFALAVHTYTNKPTVPVWSTFANRIAADSLHVLGWLNHRHLVSTPVARPRLTSDLLRTTRQRLTEAMLHQQVPLMAVWYMFGRRLVRREHLHLAFDYYRIEGPMNIAGLRASPLHMLDGLWRAADIELRVLGNSRHFSLFLRYSSERYERVGIEELLKRTVLAVFALCDSDEVRPSQLL